MSDTPNVTKAVAESASLTEKRFEEKVGEERAEFFVTSKGVKFKVKEVPQVAYMDLRNSLPEPSPPVFYNDEYDREEPNENDPRYLAAHSNWEVQMSTAVMDISLMLGCEVTDIPENIVDPDSEEFQEKLYILLKSFGWDKHEIRDVTKTERKLFWIKYEACSATLRKEDSDLTKLFNAIGRMSGVPEEDVETTIEKFRD